MKLNNYKYIYLFLFISFFLFSLYCIFFIGIAYDQIFHIENGERRLKYLLSLGRYDYYDILHLRYYPGLYDTISAFFATVFPRKFYYESFHIINFVLGITGIIGLKKVVKYFFGPNVAKIFFLISILTPVYFGHLSINPKDTIIATSNFWIIYYVIKYLKINDELIRTNISIKLGFFLGLGIGVRIIFLGTLIPILLFLFTEIFFLKKITQRIRLKNFIKHIFYILIISYILLVFCWPNTHSNIFTEPYKLFLDSFRDQSLGPQISYFFGKFYQTQNTPWYYFIINFIFKTPVIYLTTFIIFFIFYKKIKFIHVKNENFDYFILFTLVNLTLPILISIVLGLKIHDGIRYFLYLVPIFNILPAIYIDYLLKNLHINYNKVFFALLLPLLFIFLIKFITITPYQYSYINFFNDIFLKKNSFENDYWGTSTKELIRRFVDKIDDSSSIRIATCGANPVNVKYYLRKYGLKNFILTDFNSKFDYAILINRAIFDDKIKDNFTCYSKFNNKKTFLIINKAGIELSKVVKYN